jgi:hypothetical protein
MTNTNKQEKWGQALSDIDGITDSLGEHVDSKVKETVVALNLLGVHTTASCEGHVDEKEGNGLPFPWIDVAAPHELEERFIGQNKIYEEVAQEYKVSVSNIKNTAHEEAWLEALERLPKEEENETREYKEWWNKNLSLRASVRKLIDEYNQARPTSDDVRIRITADRIHNGGELDKSWSDWGNRRERISRREMTPKKFAQLRRTLANR